MENTAQQAIALLRERMASDDIRQLSDADLFRLEAICHHWQVMAASERKLRHTAANNTLLDQEVAP